MSGPTGAATASVLVVDDSPLNLEILVEYLQECGLQVLLARDGQEALQQAVAVRPDLILLDVMMPGVDGLETCRRLKADPTTAAVPVIFMTALTGTQHLTQAFAAGAVDYITKPFRLDELIARVRTHLSLVAAQRDLQERNALLQREILARQRADTALEMSERLFRGLFELAPNALVMADADGAIEMANAQAERLFGHERPELLGRRLQSLLSPEAGSPAEALFAGVLREPARPPTPIGVPFQGVRRDGARFEAEVWLNAIPTERGVMLLAAIADLSDRMALEAQLRQAQKLEAVGRMTAGVAHDFNNLFQSLSGSLELLLEATQDNEQAREWLEVALRSVTRGQGLTGQLLVLSRKQLLRTEAVPVGRLLTDLGVLIGRVFDNDPGPRIVLSIAPCAPELAVFADPAQLEAALTNLAVNARDAMPAGGELRIVARVARAEADMGIAGICCVLAVSDTGTGMDAATLSRAFEPFFTSKGARGSGLGLAMVREFARQSRGEARIFSVWGQGTTVELWLPLAGMEAASLAPEAAICPVQGHVLLVDDSADVLLTVSAFLRQAGLQVTGLSSGDQAIGRLLAGERFDAILTDVALPGLNGLDLLAQAREIDPGVPGMIITAFYNPDMAIDLENVVVLQKPFGRMELVSKLSELLRIDGKV